MFEIERICVYVLGTFQSLKGRKPEGRMPPVKEVLFLIPENLSRPFFAQLYEHCEAEIGTEFNGKLRPILRVVPRDGVTFQTKQVLDLLCHEFDWTSAIHALVVVPTSCARLTQGIARAVKEFAAREGRPLPVVALTLQFHDDNAFVELGLPRPPCVKCDNFHGALRLGERAAEHIKDCKSPCVVMVHGDRKRQDSIERIEGFWRGLCKARADLPAKPSYEIEAGWKRQAARDAFLEFVRTRGLDVQLAFCANDEMMLGLRSAIYGLYANRDPMRSRVRDCALFGFDYINEVQVLLAEEDYFVRGSVWQPLDKMAIRLAEVVRAEMEGETRGRSLENDPVIPQVFVSDQAKLQPPLWLLAAEAPIKAKDFDAEGGEWVRTAQAARIDEADEKTLKKYLQRRHSDRQRHPWYKDQWGEWGIVEKNRIWREPLGNGFLWWQADSLVPKASKTIGTIGNEPA